MPQLSNPRHERFAQEIASGKHTSNGSAYTAAGYDAEGNAAEAGASRLLKNAKGISARVAEIQAAAAVTTQVTTESLIEEAAQIQRSALQNNQHAAAVSALTAKAKLAGKWVDRKEVGQPGEFENLDADELRESIARDLATLGREDLAAALIGGTVGSGGKPN